MVCEAVIPVDIIRPAGVVVPVRRVVAPVVGRVPRVPGGAPEPVVDNRAVDIHGLDDIVLTIYILVTDNLDGHLILCILLDIDSRNVLEDILGQYGLEDDHALATLAYLDDADIVDLAVAIEVEVAEGLIGLVELGLKLLEVGSLGKEVSYDLEVKHLADVLTVGSDGDGLVCPSGGGECKKEHKRHKECR